jgi:hypothetical protein
MAEGTVRVDFVGDDHLSKPAEKGQKAVKGLGDQAKELHADFDKMSERALRVGAVVTAAFGAGAVLSIKTMADHSARMRGELGHVEQLFGKLAGQLGDSVAASAPFQALLDGIEQTMRDIYRVVDDNSDTFKGIFVEGVRAGIPVLEGLLQVTKGWLDLMVTARHLVPAAKEETVGLVGGALNAMEVFGEKVTGLFVNGEYHNARAADAARRALLAYGEGEGAVGQAADRAEYEVSRLNTSLDALGANLEAMEKRFAAGEFASRPAKSGGGEGGGRSERDRELSDYSRRLAAENERVFEEAQRAKEEARQAEADASREEMAQALADDYAYRQALLDQQKKFDEAAAAEKRKAVQRDRAAMDAMVANMAGFARTTEAAMGIVTAGLDAFGASQERQAQIVAVTTAITSAVKAGYETAESIAAFARYDYWAGAEHALAAVQYGVVAAGNMAGGGASRSSGGGGGSGSSGSSGSVGAVEPAQQRKTDQVQQSNLTLVVQGSLLRERQLLRTVDRELQRLLQGRRAA